jgi:hypothetical protein
LIEETSRRLKTMGIDVYMRWKGQTEEEKKAQITGFSVAHGHVGYLREAYHGSPYATRVLAPEAFESDDNEAQIPAHNLRERLPEVINTAMQRERQVYNNMEVTKSDPVIKAYTDFVELAEKKEQETGEPVVVVASY